MAKSFTNCGLHLSPSAVSRHVADLEYWLKVKLFIRHPKGLTLTEEGEKLLKTCHTIFKQIEEIESFIVEDKEKLQGTIKLTTPAGWISTIVVRLVKTFLNDNPSVRLNIRSLDGVPNFSKGDADVALLPFLPNDPEIHGEHLMDFHLGLFASPEYVKKHGMPKSVEDLKDHQLISYGAHEHPLENINWLLKLGLPEGQEHEPYLTVNNLYYAAEAGYGIATLAKENVLLRDNKLIPILPDIAGPILKAYYVYPKRFEKSHKIGTLLHHLKQEIHENNISDI